MKIRFSLLIITFSFFSLNAQIYAPLGRIEGASQNNNIGIGTSTPSDLLTVHGSHEYSRILLNSYGGGLDVNQADLMLWASEPGLTYSGVGIGNNITNYTTSSASLQLLNPARGGSYLRLLDNALTLNVVSNSGVNKQALSINSNGLVGIDILNASHKLEVNGNSFTHGAFISSISGNIGGQIILSNPSKTSPGAASGWNIYNMSGAYGNSLQFWAYDDLGCGTGLCSNRFTIMDNGNIGIGSTNPSNKLDVNGTIHSKEVKVDMSGWSDFVFKKEYKLPTLEQVEKHIVEKGYLENIPSEEEVLRNGINLGEMNSKLLQKIEELTLYVIEQNKKIDALEQQNEKLTALEKRLNNIESSSK